jgi:hypothetical protein
MVEFQGTENLNEDSYNRNLNMCHGLNWNMTVIQLKKLKDLPPEDVQVTLRVGESTPENSLKNAYIALSKCFFCREQCSGRL